MNLNADQKRLWLREVESIGSKEVNEPIPISMNYFAKNENELQM
jgi:hypothetical protein